MQIHGFNKTTLLDYPGIVASTVFTGGCNFRCPFCHNADLVLNPGGQPLIPEEDVFAHLAKRKGITKGVCITGGEPTLSKDIFSFSGKLKDMGLLVKLDTNGYKPDVLKKMCKEGLVDYVAMDIKASLSDYSKVTGVPIDKDIIKESVEFLVCGEIPYEFRTTVVKELHNERSFEEIADMISGANRYYLQSYVDSDRVICSGFTAYGIDKLNEFADIVRRKVETVEIRGVD